MSLELLKDWLGDGGDPVPQILADSRATLCVYGNDGKPCPFNKEPNWWERFKTAIALTIRKQLEIKHALGLKVTLENQIHMCGKCGCCLRLKVWVPTHHIKEHTTEDERITYPRFCWIRNEL